MCARNYLGDTVALRAQLAVALVSHRPGSSFPTKKEL